MRRLLLVTLAFAMSIAFVIVGAGVAAAQCPGGTQFVVATPADAALVGDGYNDVNCDLIINTSVIPTVANLSIRARTITIQGPDVNDPAKRVEIINTLPASKIFLHAQGGNIVMDQASVIARAAVQLTCTPLTCDIIATLSDLIASSTLAFGGPGGNLFVTANDVLNIQSSTVYGGAQFLVRSTRGTVTFKCVPGADACRDPNIAKPTIITDQCGDPIVFPCTPVLNNAAELKSVCIGAPGVNCGGALVELHIVAFGDIDIAGSKIDALGTFLISSQTGRILGANAQLSAERFLINAGGNAVGTNETIDFNGAMITASGSIRITASNCAALPNVCIDLENSDLAMQNSPNFPSINSDSSPPYANNTLDDAGECAVAAVVNKGIMTVLAKNALGLVTICGAQIN